MHGLYAHACSGHSGLAKAKIQCKIVSTTKQAISIKLATTVGHFVSDLDFKNVYMTWPACLVLCCYQCKFYILCCFHVSFFYYLILFIMWFLGAYFMMLLCEFFWGVIPILLSCELFVVVILWCCHNYEVCILWCKMACKLLFILCCVSYKICDNIPV